jgi:hypothetical protein
MGCYQHLINYQIIIIMETIIKTSRPRIQAVRVNPSEYAAIGTNPVRTPKVYVRATKPNRMRAIMVAATFATMFSFFDQGGYEFMGAKWCSEVWQISRFYQGDNAPIRA